MYLIGRKSMKKNVSKILLVSTSLLLACGYTVNAESLEQPEDRTGLEKANEFNEETNQTFDFFGYTFQIPEGWEKSDNSSMFTERYYVETGTGTTMFQVLCDSGIEDYEELYENREEIIESFGESFESFSSKNILEYEVAGTDAVLFDYNGSTSGIDFIGNMLVLVDDRSNNTILISMMNSTEAEYSHFDDFYKVVDSVIERNEPANSEGGNNDIPLEYSNALKSAKNYLDYTSFSYTGLISQLEYEGYSSDACTYAVDNCGADWNEQAAKKAQSYLEYSSFSRQKLIDQLLYEGFTQEQAEYGVSSVGY